MPFLVCVVGAGGAGLNSAYHLLKNGIEFCVFEKTECVGGTWVYRPEKGKDSLGQDIHSSMYRDLRTNLPVEAMAFPGFPFPEGTTSFVHHSVVRSYLENYSLTNQLTEFIQFRTKVTSIKKQEGKWIVEVLNLESGRQTEQKFTHVMICNGKYACPRIPKLKGIENFGGKVEHSHDYRHNEPYRNLRVLVMGAGPSGTDIAIEISHVAKECYLSHGGGHMNQLGKVIKQRSIVSHVELDGRIHFTTEEEPLSVDVILFCTGYLIDFPFLGKDVVNNEDGYRVSPLYKHLILATDPSLCFVGLPRPVVPFVIFDFQVRFFIKVITGDHPLPDEDEMRRDTKEDMELRKELGLGRKYGHTVIRELQWLYFQWFSDHVNGIEPLDPKVKRAFITTHAARGRDLIGYRESSLKFD